MPRLFAIAALCAATGHLLLEVTLWPLPVGLLLSITAIGAGPYCSSRSAAAPVALAGRVRRPSAR
ncbi:MAG: hypothetical protein U5K43_13755 [Halofilum sp. (in: g-proteobacteria)]|nr:hypothetical protein [Halofilum sp. (in: g-proteobacteria)]